MTEDIQRELAQPHHWDTMEEDIVYRDPATGNVEDELHHLTQDEVGVIRTQKGIDEEHTW